MTEKEFAEEIRQGDQEAFRSFVDQYQGLVVNTCMGFLHNREDVEDVAQETFIEAYQSIHRFRGDAKLSTWLYRIAVNKSLNYLRDNRKLFLSRKTDKKSSSNPNSQSYIDKNIPSNPERKLEEADRKEILKKSINTLPRNQKIAFVLNKYDNMSYKEIAEVMNMSLSSVESLIHRGKMNLQKKLLKYYKKNMI